MKSFKHKFILRIDIDFPFFLFQHPNKNMWMFPKIVVTPQIVKIF